MKSKTLRNIMLGFLCVLAGAALLYGLLRASPDSARSLLGIQESPKHKPIESALNLNKEPPPEAEDQAAIPPGSSPPPEGVDEDDFAPFAQARKMHEQMEKEMMEAFGNPGIAGSAFQNQSQIVTKEDDKSISYEISGVVGSTLNTSVRDGYLTVSGENRKVTAHSSVTSSFHQSFSLPRNVDPTKMETISEKDKVILRFPKR